MTCIKLLITICCVLGSVGCADAAPVVIGTPVTVDSGPSGVATFTIAANCPSGNSNVVAVACVVTRKSGASAVAFDAVTWDGTNMTPIGSPAPADQAGSNGVWVQQYQLANPTCDGSSHNFVIDPTPTANLYLVGSILFLKDVNLSSINDTPQTAVNNTAGPSLTYTNGATNDLVVECIGARNSGTNLVATGGQTLAATLDQTSDGSAPNNVEGVMTTKAGAASVALTWTETATSAGWGIVAASFNPATAAQRRRQNPRQYMKQSPTPVPGKAAVGLTAASQSLTARATWKDNSNNEQGFIVEKRPAGGMFTEQGRTTANVTALNVTVPAGQSTCYQVRAYNKWGVSAASNERCCTAQAQSGSLLPAIIGASAKKTFPNQPTNFLMTP